MKQGAFKKSFLFVFAVSLGMACFFSSPFLARAQDQAQNPAQAADTANRLNRIENEIQTLSRAIFRGEKPPPGSLPSGVDANVEVRLTQIEADMRGLTGKVEQQAYDIQQLRQDMNQILGRLDRIETKALSQVTAPPPARAAAAPRPLNNASSASGNTLYNARQPAGLAPADRASAQGAVQPASLPSADPVSSYENAFAMIKNGDYGSAQQAFAKFLATYPNHALSPNAKYWLGETYYVRNNFEDAARTFAEAYQQFPQGPKAPDNLLKLGMSLAGMGSKNDACVAYEQLKREYPNGPAPVLRRAQQEMSSLGC